MVRLSCTVLHITWYYYMLARCLYVHACGYSRASCYVYITVWPPSMNIITVLNIVREPYMYTVDFSSLEHSVNWAINWILYLGKLRADYTKAYGIATCGVVVCSQQVILPFFLFQVRCKSLYSCCTLHIYSSTLSLFLFHVLLPVLKWSHCIWCKIYSVCFSFVS